MKTYLVKDKNKYNKYTYRTLDLAMEKSGVELVSPRNADLFLVSVDDPDDFSLVKKARQMAGGRPVIAGGFEGFGGEYLLSYVNGVNVGEGFEFLDELGKAKDVESLLELPYILTASKSIVYPSTVIHFEKLPLVRLGKQLWYYLAGRGCKGKCAFCETGYVYPRWHNTKRNILSALNHVEKKKHRLTLITNDSAEILSITKTRCVQSVRVRDYLKEPERFKSASMLHFGIEGFSEAQRRFFLKPIKDDDVWELIRITEYFKQQIELFFITGIPGTFDAMMQFAASVPLSALAYPRIFLKLTRLDPSPHTPLWTYDLQQLESLTKAQLQEFKNVLKSRNIRFRIFQQRGNGRMSWRAALRRCSPSEAVAVGTQPKSSDSEHAFFLRLYQDGLSHLLTYDNRPMPNSQIVTPWRNMRDRVANNLNMPVVNYKVDANV